MIGYKQDMIHNTFDAAQEIYVKEGIQPFKNLSRLKTSLLNNEIDGFVIPLGNDTKGYDIDMFNFLVLNGFHLSRVINLTVEIQVISQTLTPKTITKLYGTTHLITESYQHIKEHLPHVQLEVITNVNDYIDTVSNAEKTALLTTNRTDPRHLNVILNDVRDNTYNNHQRFGFITNKLEVSNYHTKTLLAIQLMNNHSNSIYDVLHEFSLRNIRVTNIFYNAKSNVKYLYLITDKNIQDNKLKDCLKLLNNKTRRTQILGSYKE
ncbi:MAG: hypothetical protein K9L74_00960 [Candidatus Izimaplasma sp.]|nr:hypothetical protein [Candidatus Izimaplasma bacterium]